MSEISTDPVISVIRLAHRLAREHNLKDIEAAHYAAALALFGPDTSHQFGVEASYYSAQVGWTYIESVSEASRRRIQAGVFGSMETTVTT